MADSNSPANKRHRPSDDGDWLAQLGLSAQATTADPAPPVGETVEERGEAPQHIRRLAALRDDRASPSGPPQNKKTPAQPKDGEKSRAEIFREKRLAKMTQKPAQNPTPKEPPSTIPPRANQPQSSQKASAPAKKRETLLPQKKGIGKAINPQRPAMPTNSVPDPAYKRQATPARTRTPEPQKENSGGTSGSANWTQTAITGDSLETGQHIKLAPDNAHGRILTPSKERDSLLVAELEELENQQAEIAKKRNAILARANQVQDQTQREVKTSVATHILHEKVTISAEVEAPVDMWKSGLERMDNIFEPSFRKDIHSTKALALFRQRILRVLTGLPVTDGRY